MGNIFETLGKRKAAIESAVGGMKKDTNTTKPSDTNTSKASAFDPKAAAEKAAKEKADGQKLGDSIMANRKGLSLVEKAKLREAKKAKTGSQDSNTSK